jgi:hypothetical protein
MSYTDAAAHRHASRPCGRGVNIGESFPKLRVIHQRLRPCNRSQTDAPASVHQVSRPAYRLGMDYIFRPGSCNYRADMTVLTVGHFAWLGVGIVPKHPTGFV